MKRFGRSLKYVYLGVMLLFLYLPIVYLIVFSFNSFHVNRGNVDYTNIGKCTGFTLSNYADVFTGEELTGFDYDTIVSFNNDYIFCTTGDDIVILKVVIVPEY